MAVGSEDGVTGALEHLGTPGGGGYLLFAGSAYYPMGGWADYRAAYATLDEAKAVDIRAIKDANEVCCDWAQIVHDGRIVAEYGHAIYEPDATEWEDV